MCHPMGAHWRHLENTIELVLPSVHPSSQTKRQIDRFSHFCAAHGTVSLGTTSHVRSLNNCPFAWRWRGSATGIALDLRSVDSRSRVQILLVATLRNNLGQFVHTYVPLSPSSITWYRPKGGDSLRLGR